MVCIFSFIFWGMFVQLFRKPRFRKSCTTDFKYTKKQWDHSIKKRNCIDIH